MFRDADMERLVATRREFDLRPGQYDSFFVHWDARASVRQRPVRVFEEGADGARLLFPPELHPVVAHPLVKGHPPGTSERLLAWRLHDYLDFTAELESETVIPVAIRLARGRCGIELPPQMSADAWKIVTDEAWHAQFSHDFLDQLRHVVGVPTVPGHPRHAFLDRLEAIMAELPDELRGLEQLLFSIVSETLISGILSDIPRDHRLPPSVRDLVADHAADEGRHHVYFRAMLRRLWPALTPSERRAIGIFVPRVIHAFLEPDYARTAARLQAVGLSEEDSAQVITETWPEEVVSHQVATSARQTVGYFATVGAFADPEADEALSMSGLVLT